MARQVTTWRREARQGKLGFPVEDEATFAALALEAAPQSQALRAARD
jgi:transposase-like protein